MLLNISIASKIIYIFKQLQNQHSILCYIFLSFVLQFYSLIVLCELINSIKTFLLAYNFIFHRNHLNILYFEEY